MESVSDKATEGGNETRSSDCMINTPESWIGYVKGHALTSSVVEPPKAKEDLDVAKIVKDNDQLNDWFSASSSELDFDMDGQEEEEDIKVEDQLIVINFQENKEDISFDNASSQNS